MIRAPVKLQCAINMHCLHGSAQRNQERFALFCETQLCFSVIRVELAICRTRVQIRGVS